MALLASTKVRQCVTRRPCQHNNVSALSNVAVAAAAAAAAGGPPPAA
jgi:hypothetical protein